VEPALNNAHDLLAPDDLIRAMEQLPSSAQVLPRLLRLLPDQTATVQDVVQLIMIDSGMAATVLQIGNSAYYHTSRASRGLTIEDAVGRVGLVKIFELVAYAATHDLLLRRLRAYELDPDTIWRMSVAAAIAAERVATRAGLDCRVAYTLGLMHASGLIAMDAWVAKMPLPVRFTRYHHAVDWSLDEKGRFGFTNAAVAAALLRRWGFPPELTEPIRWQYNPGVAHSHRAYAAVVHAAKWLRDVAVAEAGQDEPAAPEQEILDMIPIQLDDLNELAPEVREALAKVSLVLEEPAEQPA
jgi:HD-like signal output (HDOD) protein